MLAHVNIGAQTRKYGSYWRSHPGAHMQIQQTGNRVAIDSGEESFERILNSALINVDSESRH